MVFEWDDEKAKLNQADHGVAFADILRFEHETAQTVVDDRFDYGEAREVSVGFIGNRLYVAVTTERGEATRLISLRRANKKEVRAYVENI